MASQAAFKRLTREYKLIQENPTPYITAKPSEAHILEWHYVIEGPPDTPYEGGQYHGTLMFPADYPFKPPAIRMVTPSGRFKPNQRLCLSISDFHPKTWNPAWSVSTILTGLLSFMNGDESTAGSMVTSDEQKREFAKRSHQFNANNSQFAEQFPELVKETRDKLHQQQVQAKQQAQKAGDGAGGAGSTAKQTSQDSDQSNTSAGANQPQTTNQGFLSTGKVVGICVVLLSWILASRLFGTNI